MLLQRLHDSKVELSKSRPSRQHQSCMAKTVSSLRKKCHFLLQGQLGTLAVVDKLDALDHFIVVLLYKALRTMMRLTVKIRVADRPNVFDEVLPQAMRQSSYVA